MPPSRELILETNGAWTAIFDNGSRGGDQFGPVGHLAQVEAYGPRGHLFRYPGRLRFGTKKLTLNDARARLGIV
jgi:hypothetical protein